MQFVVLEKIYKCLFIPNCTRKTVWLRINNIHENYEIAYYNYTEAKRGCKNDLFKPCEWHCAFGWNNRVLSKQKYTMPFLYLLGAKKIKVRLNSSRNCSVWFLLLLCPELTFFCIESSENCIYLNQSELGSFFMYLIITVIELSGVLFSLKSYELFQNRKSAQREFDLNSQIWFQIKIALHWKFPSLVYRIFSLCKYFIEPVKSWSVESFKSYTQTKPWNLIVCCVLIKFSYWLRKKCD